jgi:class 3 adenylate cyclase/tetratricopeptide (TPR) repeat protein
MPKCAECGQENPNVARFCLACGTPLAKSASAKEERKVVTVLFADLVGFTSRAEQLDPEDVRAMLSPYYARLRQELERRGGTVEKFIGDAVMALFGAPVAHEDDPERAVRAALAIRDGLTELNEADPKLELQVRIAVNTGEALVALGANPSEGEGMASGDVVNTAARLQAAAPVNGILVGETTYRATERAIEYREAPPVTAKGKAEAVKVWEVLEPRARYGVDIGLRGRVPLVGREREVDILLDALSRVRSESTSQLVTLMGVPGIGKSRLVVELSAAVDEDPELIFWRQGRSLPYGEGVTFWALAEIVKAQAGILETDSAEAALDKLRRAVQGVVPDEGEADWIESQLRPLAGLEDETQPGGDRQADAFGAWRRFLEHLAERSPLVLVFEDLHWADDGLLDFVDDLVEWVSAVPLLVVCIARPELLTRRPGWGGGKPNATTLSLSPLTRDDTARLVAALLEQAVLPAELQASLLARAEGNPLYAEEYVRMLQDRGFLQRDDGAWRFEGSDDLPLPESVQGIVAARLDSLAPEEKALAQDAAVIGKVFWAGAVAAVGGTERTAIEERLHALSRKEFVRRERRSSVAGEEQYIFLHVLVRDVAYGQIPRGSRSAKHRAAAEWIASLSADRSEDHAEMLAHHYLSAIELAQASRQDASEFADAARLALRDAGDRALGLNAYATAARFYDAALKLWPSADRERPQLLLRLGWAHSRAGKPEVVDVLEEASKRFLVLGDGAAAAEAQTLIGKWYGDQGLRELEDEYLQRASELVENVPPSRSKAVTLTRIGTSMMLAGRYEDGIRVTREGLQIAEELKLNDVRARCLNALGFSRVTLGDTAGVADIESALTIGLENNLPDEASVAYTNLAELVSNYFGDLKQAFELRAEGTALTERFGLAGGTRFLRAERAVECYWTGRWDEADELADDLLSESEQDAPGYMDSQCLLVKARIGLARGDARAVDYAGRALEVARVAMDPQVLYPTLAFAARAKVAAGDLEAGRALVDELLTSWSEVPETLLASHLQSCSDLAVASSALGSGTELIEIVQGARLKTKWIEAAIAFVSRDFHQAAAIYAETGSRPDEAYARLRTAREMVATGNRARGDRELQRALAFYRSVGAKAYLREGEALLAQTA